MILNPELNNVRVYVNLLKNMEIAGELSLKVVFE